MNDKLSLTELQLIIKDSLYMSFPGMYWVVAEISELSENYAGHCYLELIEKNADESNIKARIRAVIWSKKYSFLKSLFENATGESLKVGFKVLLKVTVEYHEVYGLSLVINDIDPAFTVGEMAIRRRNIIKRLEEEGVFSMNKELDFPIVPNRIAVISSKNAAGYSDFLKHLETNGFGYAFQVSLFEASMQGGETERSVVDALDRISENIGLFDIVVIIRGGGSQTDLGWFDNYNIAFHITQFPLPVLTGIGHEKDTTITDMVAFHSVKTPTAAADYIINTINETENHIAGMASSISEISLSLLNANKMMLDEIRLKMINTSAQIVSAEKNRLASVIITLTGSGKEFLIREEFKPLSLRARLISEVTSILEENNLKLNNFSPSLDSYSLKLLKQLFDKIDSLNSSLAILNPENVLRRGYSITSLNGRIIKHSGELNIGDEIDTRFSDGIIRSTISE